MSESILSNSIRETLEEWQGRTSLEGALALLGKPTELTGQMRQGAEARLIALGESAEGLRDTMMRMPYIHLKGSFNPDGLDETPHAFVPVPMNWPTVLASAAGVLTNAILGLETISYGSENDGHLFVNLVGIPGAGRDAEKSQNSMRGHTDVSAFPVRGRQDKMVERISPSPDVVILCALRNPHRTPTVVMPLEWVLPKLTPQHVAALKMNRFIVGAQGTFQSGLKKIFGAPFQREGEAVLFDIESETWVRFSHSYVTSSSDEGLEYEAMQAFQDACAQSHLEISLSPGDLLLVNNRLALHGRGEVGSDFGGTSRWLLRTYGLTYGAIRTEQRYSSESHKLFP